MQQIKAAGGVEALGRLRARTQHESVQIAALEALVALQESLCEAAPVGGLCAVPSLCRRYSLAPHLCKQCALVFDTHSFVELVCLFPLQAKSAVQPLVQLMQSDGSEHRHKDLQNWCAAPTRRF